MSATLDLVCIRCRESLWIGQFRTGQPAIADIYSSAEHLDRHSRFVVKHLGHPLVAVDDARWGELEVDEADVVEFEDADAISP